MKDGCFIWRYGILTMQGVCFQNLSEARIMNQKSYKIEWFGHCAFLFTYRGIRFLFDPYDSFQNIIIGKIESDYLLISSTWHDHGNIDASPQAHILSYEGGFDFDKGFKIYGTLVHESRGSQTVIFTILFDDGMCVTNFADWGDIDGKSKMNEKSRDIISKTKIAFMRINYIDLEKELYCYDLALSVSKPSIVIPEHYYPEAFIQRELPLEKRNGYSQKLKQVKKMTERIGYPHKVVSGFAFEESKLPSDPIFLEFSDISPQVKYQK